MDITVTTAKPVRVGSLDLKLDPTFHIIMSAEEAFHLCAITTKDHEEKLKAFVKELQEAFMPYFLDELGKR